MSESTINLTEPDVARIHAQLERLEKGRSPAVLSAFLREGAARRWLRGALRISAVDYQRMLADFDARRAELLPETFDAMTPRTQKKTRAVLELITVQLRKKGVRGTLAAIRREQARDALNAADESIVWRGSAAKVPRDWRLQLPIPPAKETIAKISPTRLDVYMHCPFTYFLQRKDILGDKRFNDRVDRLAPWEFGNLIHAALEEWGASELRDSGDRGEIAAFLDAAVDRWLAARFGGGNGGADAPDAIPAAVGAQAKAAKARLGAFAELQAARRREGWRIVAAEKKLEFHLGETLIYGKCDRIERHEPTGAWCVLDYKAWDRADHAAAFTVSANGERNWNGLQLPLYCAMILASNDELFQGVTAESLSAGYLVLPENPSQTAITGIFSATDASDAVDFVREKLLDGLEHGIFWPPSTPPRWRRDYDDWLNHDPINNVEAAWLHDQLQRRGTFAAETVAEEAANFNAVKCALLDLLQIADHPGDLLTFRHFHRTPLVGLATVENVWDFSAQLAETFAAKGIVATLRLFIEQLIAAGGKEKVSSLAEKIEEFLQKLSNFLKNREIDARPADAADIF